MARNLLKSGKFNSGDRVQPHCCFPKVRIVIYIADIALP
jgi:hypothetical protein